MPPTPALRRPGRPRRASTDAAILRAAVELMTEAGVDGTTLTDVAKRAGVTRATVYLRWPTRSALIGAAARVGVGGVPMHLSGHVETDIRFGAAYIRRIFDSPTFQALLPEIVRGVLAHPQDVSFDSVAPRRRDFGRIYRERAALDGFDPDVDPYLAFDMILGTAIGHLLANGRPMSEAEANVVGDVIIKGLRRSPLEHEASTRSGREA